MRFYGIDFVAHELDVHPSSLRRWEENGLISPERVAMGKTTLRIYDEDDMRVLRQAKDLMDTGMGASDAFDPTLAEIEHTEEQHDD
jgi:MerR family transcriptional regulator, heat shock protein HspR